MFVKVLDLLTRTARETPELYSFVFSKIGSALKVGAVEDEQRRSRLIDLIRFYSSFNESVSLNDYISRAKKGQTQIFYVAATGANPAELEKSVFTETALARGYEVCISFIYISIIYSFIQFKKKLGSLFRGPNR